MWLCQWVTCPSWQLYWWTLAESKVEYCVQKHSRFDTCLIFAVDCMLLMFCLFVPGTMCTGGRLAKTGVNSARVSRLGHSSVQSGDVPWNKGHELHSLLGWLQLSASVRLAGGYLDMQLSFYASIWSYWWTMSLVCIHLGKKSTHNPKTFC